MTLVLLLCAVPITALLLLIVAARLSVSDVDRYLSDVDRLWDSGGDS